MSDINWQNGAVCYGDGRQWFANTDYESDKFELVNNDGSRKYSLYGILNFPKDFQLNEIREGDFIPASELDTEQKYNDVVEVFRLSGFKRFDNASYAGTIKAKTDSSCLKVNPSGELICNWHKGDRQLTYNQIIAIGKLKRMMLEREKSAPKTTTDLTPDKQKSAVDYLNECVEVQKQRGEQYDSSGTGERSFSACADAYNAITGGKLKGSDICLILQILKDVRQYSNPSRLHEDSVLDKVSYSSLHAEELNKELK